MVDSYSAVSLMAAMSQSSAIVLSAIVSMKMALKSQEQGDQGVHHQTARMLVIIVLSADL